MDVRGKKLRRVRQLWTGAVGMAMLCACAPLMADSTSPIMIPSQEAVGKFPVVELKSAVPWGTSPIRVDGDLSDWPKSPPAVVMEGNAHTWTQGANNGKDDLSATVWLTRDDQNLYIAVKAQDDQLPPPDSIAVSFAAEDSPIILGWRDVGQRYRPDDVDVLFSLNKDSSVGMTWVHVQDRMDHSVVQNSFGSEEERVAQLKQSGGQGSYQTKIFAKYLCHVTGDNSVTTFEAAIPWKTLMPYVPVSYGPLRMNIAVSSGRGQSQKAVAWAPGIVGVHSTAHFPSLTFTPPSGRTGVDTYADLPGFDYVAAKIPAAFSFYNHGDAQKAQLQLFDNKSQTPVATADITLPSGYSQKTISVDSETIGAGQWTFHGLLTVESKAPVTIPVFAPTVNDALTVHSVAKLQAKIDTLEANTASLQALYDKVKAKKGLDTTYPLAYLTIMQMFVPEVKESLKGGDTARVTMNTDTLLKFYQYASSYMQEILKDPKAQLKAAPRLNPDTLKIKDGYFVDDGRPVFLYGPATFWYLRQDQQTIINLGFNSVTSDIEGIAKDPKMLPEVNAQLQRWYDAGVVVNAHVDAPELMLTGADVKRSKLLQEHPEVLNTFQNNFLPFLVQSPFVRPVIDKDYQKDVDFWKGRLGVTSYWLWNEPWYTNYSEQTRQDFINKYLEPKYKTIAALNQRWMSDYKSFDEIKLIQWPDPNNYAPWYDFQQFRDQILGDFFDFLTATVKNYDSSRPTMTKFMAPSLHSFNIARLTKSYDINGFDGSSGDRDIPYLDYVRSVYPERPLMNPELHLAYAGKEDVEMAAWRLALHGLGNANWWCWHSNPGFSDSIKNAKSIWGLTQSSLDVQRLFYPYIYDLNEKPSTVATLFPDVVERRSDITMVRIRYEEAMAQYRLGIKPFYAIESQVTDGQLSKHKLLLAGESNYAKQSTFDAVVDYVKGGGTVIVTSNGFSHDEYGAPRDTSALIKEGGEQFGEYAHIYSLGKGKVIRIDAFQSLPDVVTDGGTALRGDPMPGGDERRYVYQQVLAQAMANLGLNDDVRIVSSDPADHQSLSGFDWRSVKKGNGYTLAVLPYDNDGPFKVKLDTSSPLKSIVNLITGKKISPRDFKLDNGPNLFYIELTK